MSNYYITNDGIRLRGDAGNDGSFIDQKDGKRKRYHAGKLQVLGHDGQWVDDRIVTTDSSNGAKKSPRQVYLDAINARNAASREPRPATPNAASAPAEDEKLSIRERYLREIRRQSNNDGI